MTWDLDWNRRQFLIKSGAAAAALGLGRGLWHPALADEDAIDSISLTTLLPQEDIDKLLSAAMARGGDFAEVFAEAVQATRITMEENEIRNARLGISLGVGIRTVTGDRVGYAYSDDLSMDKLMKAAETASNIASGQGPGKTVPVSVSKIPDRYCVQEPSDLVPPARKIELLQRANTAGYAADKAVHNIILSYNDTRRRILAANTDGRLVEDNQSTVLLWAYAMLEEADKRQTGFYGDGGRVGFEFFDTTTPESMAQNAVNLARINLGAEDAPAGPMPVVLNGKFGGLMLHEAIGHGMEADFNRKGLSTYSGRLGQKIAPDFIRIEDDGDWDSKELGTLNVDDEGTECGRTVLVEGGVLKQYMQDRISARVMNLKPTGNGRRQDFRNTPMPRMTNTILRPGDKSPDEIISTVPRGLFVKSISNGRVDIAAGDFMFYVEEAYLIEDGKVTRPVKGATLIGNGPEALSKIEMVGNDFAMGPSMFVCGKNGQSVDVGFGMPTIKIKEITVGGTKS